MGLGVDVPIIHEQIDVCEYRNILQLVGLNQARPCVVGCILVFLSEALQVKPPR